MEGTRTYTRTHKHKREQHSHQRRRSPRRSAFARACDSSGGPVQARQATVRANTYGGARRKEEKETKEQEKEKKGEDERKKEARAERKLRQTR